MVLLKHQKRWKEAEGSNLPAGLVHIKLGCNIHLLGFPSNVTRTVYNSYKGALWCRQQIRLHDAVRFIFRLESLFSSFAVTFCFSCPVTEDKMLVRDLLCLSTSPQHYGPGFDDRSVTCSVVSIKLLEQMPFYVFQNTSSLSLTL